MSEFIVIRRNEQDPRTRIAGLIEGNKNKTLKQVGKVKERAARDSFRHQSFFEFGWEVRYPSQEPPHINVAGAIADFQEGRTKPLGRRFQQSPVLIDSGSLRRSISYQVRPNEDSVEVGSTLPYAANHQWGGVSTQPVSEEAKKRMRTWIFKKGGMQLGGGKLIPATQPNVRQWDTVVVQRPFLGVPKGLEPEIVSVIEKGLARGGGS